MKNLVPESARKPEEHVKGGSYENAYECKVLGT